MGYYYKKKEDLIELKNATKVVAAVSSYFYSVCM
jgi:hypothetical protein